MKIDLTTVLNKRCDRLDIDYYFDASCLDSEVELPFGMTLSEPVHVVGTVSDQNNCMFLKAKITAPYVTACDRYLAEIKDTAEFDFERMISVDAPAAPDPFDESEDDIIYVSESGIDIDAAVFEEIALELPVYHLCKEDCKGLCPKCGKNLNDGCCGCTEEKEIDPRLKKLQKLLDNFE